MAPQSSTLTQRIPGTAEPGGLPSTGVAQSRTRLKPLSILSVLDCTCSLAKILYKLASPPTSLEQFLRATEKLFPRLYAPQ